MGLLFILVFSVWLGWLPFIYNSTLQVNDLESLGRQLRQSIMPIAVLALVQTATLMRYVRSAAIDTMYKDYVRTAYAKGLPRQQVVQRHVLRNAMIPVITLIALGVPSVFTGAIIVEQIFRVPGIGTLLISGIQARYTGCDGRDLYLCHLDSLRQPDCRPALRRRRSTRAPQWAKDIITWNWLPRA